MHRLKPFRHQVYRTRTGLHLLGFARGKPVPAGPEEFVRQDVLRTLAEEYGYPRACLLAEEPVARGTTNRRRADVVVELPVCNVERHNAVVGDGRATDFARSPAYSAMVEKLNRRLKGRGGVHVLSVPDELEVELDGQAVRGQVLGFSGAGHALDLWMRPEGVHDLPEVIGFHVLGYGLTAKERSVAVRLGLPEVHYNDPDRDYFYDCYTALFGLDEELGIAAGPCVSQSDHDGWFVLSPEPEIIAGVLCYAEIGAAEWGKFFRARINHMPVIVLPNGAVAYRERMDELGAGDLVLVFEGDDGLEGSIMSTGATSVQVDCGPRGVVEARRVMTGPDDTWLAGRVARLHEATGGETTAMRELQGFRTFIVVECKAPTVSFSEEVKQQGLDYAMGRGAAYLALTNGTWVRSYYLKDGSYEGIESDLPTYEEAISSDEFRVARAPEALPHRALPPDADERPDLVAAFARYRGDVVGADVAERLWGPILRIDDALSLASSYDVSGSPSYGVQLKEDLGLRWHEPGNAAGGTFAGQYRDFLVADDDGNEGIFGVRVTSTMKGVNHPRWGNVAGRTYLMCCVSVGATYAPVLECRLDRYLERDGDLLSFWHSGAATVGKGAVKRAAVLDYVRERRPELCVGDAIDLGSIPCRPNLGWSDLSDWIARIAGYVWLRDAFKQAVRGKRRMRKRRK